MKNWYIMIHFDGYYVSGFLVFNQPDQESARKKLLSDLIVRKKHFRTLEYNKCYAEELRRILSYISSLNHPWRHTKRNYPLVKYREFTNETVDTGFWLANIITGEYYCNLQS